MEREEEAVRGEAASGRELARLALWLYGDVFRRVGWRSIGLLALSALSVGARAASIATLVLFVKAQASGEAVQVLGFELPSAVTLANLLLWGGTALFFAMVTAATAFWVDHLVFRISRAYAQGLVRQLADHLASGGRLRSDDGRGERDWRSVERMLAGDFFGLVRTVTFILGIVLPLITLLVAAGALVKLEPVLTAVLLPVLPIYLIPLALLNRKLAHDAHTLQTLRPALRRNVREMLQGLAETPAPTPEARERARGYADDPLVGESIEAFRDYVLARRRVDNLRDVFQGVSLLAILLMFGAALAQDGASWAMLLTYLVALQYATKSLGKVSKFVTLTSRYLPQIGRYWSFVTQDLPRGEAREAASGPEGEAGSAHGAPDATPAVLP
ncbi:MAG: hypothetical protein ACR2P8_05710 [Myxococcota bacterium]